MLANLLALGMREEVVGMVETAGTIEHFIAPMKK